MTIRIDASAFDDIGRKLKRDAEKIVEDALAGRSAQRRRSYVRSTASGSR